MFAEPKSSAKKEPKRARFFRGEVDKYSWVDIGSSYLPSDILAALLCAQLERRETIQRARKRIWDCYASELASWAGEHEVGLPFVPATVNSHSTCSICGCRPGNSATH